MYISYLVLLSTFNWLRQRLSICGNLPNFCEAEDKCREKTLGFLKFIYFKLNH